MHRGVTAVVVGAASIAALQLGLTGPALSPVQTVPAQAAAAAASTGTRAAGTGAATQGGTVGTQDQGRNQNRDDTGGPGGRGGRGGGGGGR